MKINNKKKSVQCKPTTHIRENQNHKATWLNSSRFVKKLINLLRLWELRFNVFTLPRDSRLPLCLNEHVTLWQEAPDPR